jgi:type II secretory pathway pseudopilin PulG
VIKAMLETLALLGVLVTLALLVALALKAQQENADLRAQLGQTAAQAAKAQREIRAIQERLDQLVQKEMQGFKDSPETLAPPVPPGPRERRATRETPVSQEPLGLRDPEIVAYYAPWWRTWLG